MKRRCDDALDEAEARRKRRATASAGGGAAEQRSGVVTVAAAAAADTFKPTPPRSRRPETPPEVPSHATREKLMASMLKVAERMFLTPPTSKDSWGKECAVITCVFYSALVHPACIENTVLKSITVDFIRRWLEETEGDTMDSLLNTREEWHKCGAFFTFVLLHANLLPEDSISIAKLRTLPHDAKWHGEIRPPEWLLSETACFDNLVPFNSALLLSAEILQGGWEGRELNKSSKTSMGTLARFLHAVGLYREGNFSGSLLVLDEIPSKMCCKELQGCVLWLTGLNLAKMEKPHTAQLKLEAAVKVCEACLPAVFNISRIFNQSDMVTAELECLALLAAAGVERVHVKSSLQASLIALHHTTPVDLPLRALYLLAARCLQIQKVEEASNKFTQLLERLERTTPPLKMGSIPSAKTKVKTWLRNEDEIPVVPRVECIRVQAAIAYLGEQNVQSAFDTLLHLESDDIDVGNCDIYTRGEQEKLRIFTSAVGSLIKIEALSILDKKADSLKECIWLEQALTWVRYTDVSKSTGWELLAMMMKALLYTWLSYLHGAKANKQNRCHYQRRAAQYAKMLQDVPLTVTCPDLTLTESLTVQIFFCYLKSSLQYLSEKEGICFKYKEKL